MRKKYTLSVIGLFIIALTHAQSYNNFTVVKGKIEGVDTLYMVDMQPVVVYPELKFNNDNEYKRYKRLISNLKKVYPYALMARNTIAETNNHLATLKTERERKAYLKVAEKQLFDQFEGDLRKLTISQGRLLIKLIDRETGNNSYVWIKQYKGSFSAGLWQGVAVVFGSSLKSEFNEKGDDKLIDAIIKRIDAGML